MDTLLELLSGMTLDVEQYSGLLTQMEDEPFAWLRLNPTIRC